MKKTLELSGSTHTGNLKNIRKQQNENGITLIVLVITLIILLILSGITIATLTGENGLFARAKQAKNEYEISEAKETLELAITDLRIQQEGKGENLKKEDLPKINSNEIDVGDTTSFPVEVICKRYKFNVDENFAVTYVGEVDGTVITYTTNPVGYTNQDKIKISIKAISTKGIKEIEYPNGDKISKQGQTEIEIDYEVTANGIYIFKIVDSENKEIIKEVVIDQIDKLAPVDFTPTIENIKTTNFTIKIDVEDEEKTDTSTKSGIERYEIYANNKKYETNKNTYTVENLTPNTQYSIYVIAYDKASNSKQSNSIKITTKNGEYSTLTANGVILPEVGLAIDALAVEAYDNDFTTYANCDAPNTIINKLLISPECIGKYITLYTCTMDGSGYGRILFFSSTNSKDKILSDYLYNLSGDKNFGKKTAKSIKIPENTKMIALNDGTNSVIPYYVYEIKCTDENLTGTEF